MSESMDMKKLRKTLAAVMDGLQKGELDPTTAHEISNAAGKYISSVQTDLAGEVLKLKVKNFNHEALSLTPVIEAEPIKQGGEK